MTTSNSHSPRSLPLQGNAQWLASLLLAALLISTRGQHFATIQALPSASWAVFFLAGALLRPVGMLVLLMALSSLVDFTSLMAGNISDWCLSPAYWALLLAYLALWLGGRAYTRWLHRADWYALPWLAWVLVVSASVAYLLSKGGFYFFSGRYPDADLAGFVARIAQYYPRALGTLAGYAGTGVLLATLWQKRAAPSPQRAAA
jgi:hypothetical protein